jgi:flagellar hook-associated protein 3 FlgL
MRDMNYNISRLQTIQEQMTSGKEIRRPSDDPFKVARAMQLHTDISTSKQYKENISDAINWLDVTDTALGQGGNVLQRIHELLISAGNAGYSDSERRAIKDEINEKIGEFSQILNTNFDGKYVFGGSRGTTKPVDVEGGVEYKNTEVVSIDNSNIEEWKKKIEFTDNSTPPKSVEIDLTGIDFENDKNNASDLAREINKQLEDETKNTENVPLKVIANSKDNSIMFVYTDENKDNKLNVTAIKDSSGTDSSISGVNTSTEISVAEVIDRGNAELSYYRKGGGTLDTNASTGTDDAYQYNMIGQKLKTEISQGVTMEYNVTATEILEFKNEKGESKNLMDIFKSIVNHLDGKNADGTEVTDGDPDPIEALTGSDLQNMKDAISNLLKVRSEVGAKQNRMDSAKDRNIEENFNMTEILSHTEDIDITEKTMQYATMQTVYIASLQTSAKVLQPSLIDYVR